jgi:hypothetical protein
MHLDLLAGVCLSVHVPDEPAESSAAQILQTLCHEASSDDCVSVPEPSPCHSEDTVATEMREDEAGGCGFDECEWEDLDDRPPVRSGRRWDDQSENIKGPWSAFEDAQLIALVREHGGKHWARIASMLPGRTGKQCRERWCNNLDPSLKKGSWSAEEDETILAMHAELGTRWAEIAKSLPGRSDNSVRARPVPPCPRPRRSPLPARTRR